MSPGKWSTPDSWNYRRPSRSLGDLPRQPSDVEDMIQIRLEEKNWIKESWQEEEERWPREFWMEG